MGPDQSRYSEIISYPGPDERSQLSDISASAGVLVQLHGATMYQEVNILFMCLRHSDGEDVRMSKDAPVLCNMSCVILAWESLGESEKTDKTMLNPPVCRIDSPFTIFMPKL